jgi:pilus assembly protein Flp/PilA
MRHLLHRFIHQDDGATAIEYGLIAALIAVAIVAALLLLGPQLATVFGTVSTSLGAATT